MAVVIDGTNGVTVPAGATGDEVPQAQEIPASVKSTLNATGVAPVYACRAWVNFNGTGTVAIRASGNVSSITDNGTGDYTVNFTTAMPNANYLVLASSSADSNTDLVAAPTGTPLTTSVRVLFGEKGVANRDQTYAGVAVIC